MRPWLADALFVALAGLAAGGPFLVAWLAFAQGLAP